MPGRPKKKKVRGKNESRAEKTSGKLSKIGSKMTCSIYHQEGHNRANCSHKNSQVQ